MTEPTITGTLENWIIVSDFGPRQAVGAIYGDAMGRFKDGEIVRTSKIVSGPDNGLIHTRNSVYRLGAPRP